MSRNLPFIRVRVIRLSNFTTQKLPQNPLSYSLRSLKDIALRRVAVMLCSHPAFICSVAKINLALPPEQAEAAVQSMRKSILSKLMLPELLKKEMVCLMKPLCREIAKWVDFHEKFFKKYVNMHCIDILQHLCWTPVLTIDYKKTAQALIFHEKLEIHERYKLACLYCMSDEIRQLWRKIPERTKTCFYDERSPLRVKKPEIVVFWTYSIKRRVHDLNDFLRRDAKLNYSILQYVFEAVAVQGYISATNYFCSSLSNMEKEAALMRTFDAVIDERSSHDGTYRQEYQKFDDVLFDLLKIMTDVQRRLVIMKHPFEILKCCLDWPRQDFFVVLAKLAFPYLKVDDYSKLLSILSKNITSEYNYSNIFREFLLMSPSKFIDYSLRQYGLFLGELFNVGDVETVKFIFRNLDAAAKVKLVFSNSAFESCCDLIRKDKWHFLELFVREAMLSDTDKFRFTMTFAASYPSYMAKDSCQMFVALVNSIESKHDKATQMEESPAKKHKRV